MISDSSGYLDVSVFKFNNTTGWELDASVSSEDTILSTTDQVFTLFDVDKNNKFEIIRISPNQIDVIYLDSGSNWVVKENVTNLSGYNYINFDLEYEFGSTDTKLVLIQQDQQEEHPDDDGDNCASTQWT